MYKFCRSQGDFKGTGDLCLNAGDGQREGTQQVAHDGSWEALEQYLLQETLPGLYS